MTRSSSQHFKDIIRRGLVARYEELKGSAPRLDPPVSFNEHVLHRIIEDRDPKLRVVCDKLAVRRFIAERLGPQFVVPLLGAWTSAAAISWDMFPEFFVLKPSHSSGTVRLVAPAGGYPRPADEVLDGWLAEDYFRQSLEWGYLGLPRRILAEPVLRSPDGRQPLEIQIQVVKGRTVQIGLITGQKGARSRYGDWFYADGRRHPGRRREPLRHDPLPSFVRREVLPLAEHIAADFIHMRVDFYVTDSGLKVGELTPYPGGGLSNFDPPELDEEMGRLWTSLAGAE